MNLKSCANDISKFTSITIFNSIQMILVLLFYGAIEIRNLFYGKLMIRLKI